MGPVTAVRAEGYHAYPIKTDDTMSARITMASGVPVTVAVTLCADREFEPYVRVSGSDGEARAMRADRALRAAGIGPGHPSLYPSGDEQ